MSTPTLFQEKRRIDVDELEAKLRRRERELRTELDRLSIDDFESYNDTFEHLAGDQVLSNG